MKKADYIIISIVLLIGVILGIMFIKPNSSDYEILYRNINVDYININDSCVYTITSSNDLKSVIIYKNDIEIKTITYNLKEAFTNIIVVEKNSIYMKEATCPHHDCLKMKITKNSSFPIVCTNGVVIKSTNKRVEIIT